MTDDKLNEDINIATDEFGAPIGPPKWSNLPTISFKKHRRKSLGEILIETSSITEEQLKEALETQEQGDGEKRKIGEILLQKEYIDEEDILKALAYQLDLPYYDKLPINDIDPSLVDNIPIQFCRDNKILPIARDEMNVTVAVADPLNVFPLDDLRLILSTNINMVVSGKSIIENAINRVYERSNDASQSVIDELSVPDISGEDDLEETRDLLETSNDEKPIIKLVSGLLSQAVKEKASDIHIEPYEHELMVRFRIDGVLRDKMQIPRRHAGSVATRIKIISKLNIAEKRMPQDGRISIRVAGRDMDVRVSVLPVKSGEKSGERIVLRILDKSGGARNLEQMGLEPNIYETWCSLIEQKHGIILVTGPTGSGKSTLLYASLKHINTTDINILTIEDPIEYQLSGVGQMETKEKIGLTFAVGLRHILRQDPNVIMIGEIRDAETAQIAIQSSMTGHLVLSTLHTNDTASTVTRLVDLGIQPFQISSTVLGISATRLLRKLCTVCREAYVPTDRDLLIIGINEKDLAGRKLYRPGPGCESCFGLGYRERVGVYELMIMNDKLRATLLNTQDSKIIKKVALEGGMKTLRDAAILKALSGITSLDEAIHATQTDELNVS